MDAHLVGDVLHLQRPQVHRPLLEEVLLRLHQGAGDVEDGAAALLDGVDEPAGALELLAQVVLRLRVEVLLLEAPGVVAAYAQGRQLGVLEHDAVLALDQLDLQVGDDVRCGGLAVEGAGDGVEPDTAGRRYNGISQTRL